MKREEAIEILEETGFIAHSMTDVDTALDMAIEALKDRPKGEWIVHNIVCREEICLPYECPNCGFRYSRRFNFCSNCGADMRGEENE